MSVEIQYGIISFVAVVIGWAWRSVGHRLLIALAERLEQGNEKTFQDISNLFHRTVESRIITMIQAELLNLGLDDTPEQIIESQQRIAGGVVVSLRKWLSSGQWGLMQRYAYSYIDSDNDYLVGLVNDTIYGYIADLYEDMRRNAPPSDEDSWDDEIGKIS